MTCEHGGNDLPDQYRDLFSSAGAQKDLKSHRGYDPGALQAAKRIADRLDCQFHFSTITRLLVDLNRSIENPTSLSKYTNSLPAMRKAKLLAGHYHPYRDQVIQSVSDGIERSGYVIHLSIHTFTARFRGQWRPIDIGLLFDPERENESALCRAWRQQVQQQRTSAGLRQWRVEMNRPYFGTDDGLTTTIRNLFTDDRYCGIEVEISNRYAKQKTPKIDLIADSLVDALQPIFNLTQQHNPVR
ncbi:N-formylglutamate amidohydrolase [Stieleria sp. JC731]|uniref:N-formylglutamate amidohydrolase n=1 Tax=Stieleria sp. JC731 TaxID=2894195 RepID=UPI0028F3F46A|nr:N-formylglutamate amidohydrolase [Stieleria sp. JC731]